MSFGAEVYDGENMLVFTSEALTTGYIGRHVCLTRSGSITVPVGAGEVWAQTPVFSNNLSWMGMEVWVIGSTVYWQMFFSQVSDYPVIVYGRYS